MSLADLPAEAVAAFYALGAFAPKPDRFSRAAAEAVTQADVSILALLAARNLVEVEEQDFLLHQVLADVARIKIDEAAVGRHRDYYLALVNENREAWQVIEAAYGQIKWAWQSTTQEQDRLYWVEALNLYQNRRGLWRDYLAWHKVGVEAARTLVLRNVEGIILNNMGSVYANLGQRDKALDYFQQALPIYEDVGDRYGESITRYNMATIYRAQKRLVEAVAQLRQVVKLDRMVQHPDLESDMTLLAEVEAELAASEGGGDPSLS